MPTTADPMNGVSTGTVSPAGYHSGCPRGGAATVIRATSAAPAASVVPSLAYPGREGSSRSCKTITAAQRRMVQPHRSLAAAPT